MTFCFHKLLLQCRLQGFGILRIFGLQFRVVDLGFEGFRVRLLSSMRGPKPQNPFGRSVFRSNCVAVGAACRLRVYRSQAYEGSE